MSVTPYFFQDDERWRVMANKTIESLPYRYFEDEPITVLAGYVKRDGAIVLLNGNTGCNIN